MRTFEEVMSVMRDHMTPEEIVEATGITAEDLAECLRPYVEDNFDEVSLGLEEAGFEETSE